MPQDKLPLFPLGVVLFPGAALPLHIFEDRYREMIGEAIEAGSEFGIIYATERGMSRIGCAAVVEEVLKRYPDGRLDILTRGRRRFEVILLHEERSFLEGSVSPYADEDLETPAEALRAAAIAVWRDWMVLENGSAPEPDVRRPELSFYLADALPDTEFRQMLLTLRSERERLLALVQFLPKFIEREKVKRTIKRVAPLNGHSKHLSDQDL